MLNVVVELLRKVLLEFRSFSNDLGFKRLMRNSFLIFNENQEALSKLIVHSAHAGITKITLYDPWSYIFSNREILRELTNEFMHTKRSKEVIDIEFFDSDHPIIHPNFIHTAVKILGAQDGRQSIVRACQKLCVECEPANITVEQISECLAKEHICEPDFLLQIGNLKTMAGYSPWVLRITEILQLKSLPSNFSHHQFLSYLHEYSSRDRRIGR
ncbi:unnamed protein product [Onchocerca ochengi]|uniref:ditrans,polycis-polyprenyl diphosphate synthase [(2E,6E)-farnesyldiphosphate specific] n=1 Tax=Onchocerca ochengi TaxID=42157 RepID=A0A182ECI0_ONCOC|nr:unnamed protein product [Onchocerca ochengi]